MKVEELDFDEAEAHGFDGTGRAGKVVRVFAEGRTFVGYETTTPLAHAVLKEGREAIVAATEHLGVSVDEFVITSAVNAAQSWLDQQD